MIVFDREYSLKICVQISTTLILLLRHKSSRSSVAFVIHLVQSSVLVLHDERAAAADASIHIVPVSHLLCVPYGLSILLVIFLRLVDFVHGVPVSRVLVVLTSMTWMVVCSGCRTTTCSHSFKHVLWRGPHGSSASVHLLKLLDILRHFRLMSHRNVYHVLASLCSRFGVFSWSESLVVCWGHCYLWVLDERWIWSNTAEAELFLYYHWSLYVLMHLNLLSRCSICLIHNRLSFDLLLLGMVRYHIFNLWISIERFLVFGTLLSHHLVHVSCSTIDDWRLGNSIRTTSTRNSWALTWVLAILFSWLLAKVLRVNTSWIVWHMTQSRAMLLVNLSLLVTRRLRMIHVAIGKWVLNTICDCRDFLNRHVVWTILLLWWTSFVRLQVVSSSQEALGCWGFIQVTEGSCLA